MTPPTLSPADSESVGVSAARLARIIPALNAEIEAGQLPGAVVAIARHDGCAGFIQGGSAGGRCGTRNDSMGQSFLLLV